MQKIIKFWGPPSSRPNLIRLSYSSQRLENCSKMQNKKNSRKVLIDFSKDFLSIFASESRKVFSADRKKLRELRSRVVFSLSAFMDREWSKRAQKKSFWDRRSVKTKTRPKTITIHTHTRTHTNKLQFDSHINKKKSKQNYNTFTFSQRITTKKSNQLFWLSTRKSGSIKLQKYTVSFWKKLCL